MNSIRGKAFYNTACHFVSNDNCQNVCKRLRSSVWSKINYGTVNYSVKILVHSSSPQVSSHSSCTPLEKKQSFRHHRLNETKANSAKKHLASAQNLSTSYQTSPPIIPFIILFPQPYISRYNGLRTKHSTQISEKTICLRAGCKDVRAFSTAARDPTAFIVGLLLVCNAIRRPDIVSQQCRVHITECCVYTCENSERGKYESSRLHDVMSVCLTGCFPRWCQTTHQLS